MKVLFEDFYKERHRIAASYYWDYDNAMFVIVYSEYYSSRMYMREDYYLFGGVLFVFV